VDNGEVVVDIGTKFEKISNSNKLVDNLIFYCFRPRDTQHNKSEYNNYYNTLDVEYKNKAKEAWKLDLPSANVRVHHLVKCDKDVKLRYDEDLNGVVDQYGQIHEKCCTYTKHLIIAIPKNALGVDVVDNIFEAAEMYNYKFKHIFK